MSFMKNSYRPKKYGNNMYNDNKSNIFKYKGRKLHSNNMRKNYYSNQPNYLTSSSQPETLSQLPPSVNSYISSQHSFSSSLNSYIPSQITSYSSGYFNSSQPIDISQQPTVLSSLPPPPPSSSPPPPPSSSPPPPPSSSPPPPPSSSPPPPPSSPPLFVSPSPSLLPYSVLEPQLPSPLIHESYNYLSIPSLISQQNITSHLNNNTLINYQLSNNRNYISSYDKNYNNNNNNYNNNNDTLINYQLSNNRNYISSYDKNYNNNNNNNYNNNNDTNDEHVNVNIKIISSLPQNEQKKLRNKNDNQYNTQSSSLIKDELLNKNKSILYHKTNTLPSDSTLISISQTSLPHVSKKSNKEDIYSSQIKSNEINSLSSNSISKYFKSPFNDTNIQDDGLLFSSPSIILSNRFNFNSNIKKSNINNVKLNHKSEQKDIIIQSNVDNKSNISKILFNSNNEIKGNINDKSNFNDNKNNNSFYDNKSNNVNNTNNNNYNNKPSNNEDTNKINNIDEYQCKNIFKEKSQPIKKLLNINKLKEDNNNEIKENQLDNNVYIIQKKYANNICNKSIKENNKEITNLELELSDKSTLFTVSSDEFDIDELSSDGLNSDELNNDEIFNIKKNYVKSKTSDNKFINKNIKRKNIKTNNISNKTSENIIKNSINSSQFKLDKESLSSTTLINDPEKSLLSNSQQEIIALHEQKNMKKEYEFITKNNIENINIQTKNKDIKNDIQINDKNKILILEKENKNSNELKYINKIVNIEQKDINTFGYFKNGDEKISNIKSNIMNNHENNDSKVTNDINLKENENNIKIVEKVKRKKKLLTYYENIKKNSLAYKKRIKKTDIISLKSSKKKILNKLDNKIDNISNDNNKKKILNRLDNEYDDINNENKKKKILNKLDNKSDDINNENKKKKILNKLDNENDNNKNDNDKNNNNKNNSNKNNSCENNNEKFNESKVYIKNNNIKDESKVNIKKKIQDYNCVDNDINNNQSLIDFVINKKPENYISANKIDEMINNCLSIVNNNISLIDDSFSLSTSEIEQSQKSIQTNISNIQNTTCYENSNSSMDAPYPTLILSPKEDLKNIKMKIDLGFSPSERVSNNNNQRKILNNNKNILFEKIKNDSDIKREIEEIEMKNFKKFDFNNNKNSLKNKKIKENNNNSTITPDESFNSENSLKESIIYNNSNSSYNNYNEFYSLNIDDGIENKKRSFDTALRRNNEIYNIVKRIKLGRYFNNSSVSNNKVYISFMNYYNNNTSIHQNNNDINNENNNNSCLEQNSQKNINQNVKDIGEVLYNINPLMDKLVTADYLKVENDLYQKDDICTSDKYGDDDINNHNNNIYINTINSKTQDNDDNKRLSLEGKTKNLSKNLFSSDITKNERSRSRSNNSNGNSCINHEKIKYDESLEFENSIISQIKKETSFDIIFKNIQRNKDKLTINIFKRIIEEGIKKNSPYIIKTIFLISRDNKDKECLKFKVEDFQYFLSLVEFYSSDVDTFKEIIEGLQDSDIEPPALFVVYICSLFIKYNSFEEIDNILEQYANSFLYNKYQKKQAIHRLIMTLLEQRLINETYKIFILLDQNDITINEKDFINIGFVCANENYINSNIFSDLTKMACKQIEEYSSPYIYWEEILSYCILKEKEEPSIIVYKKLIKNCFPSFEILKLFIEFSIKHNYLNEAMKRLISCIRESSFESTRKICSNPSACFFFNNITNICIEYNYFSHSMWIFFFMNRHNIKINDTIFNKLLVKHHKMREKELEDFIDIMISKQPQIDLDYLASISEEFYDHGKYRISNRILYYIKSKSYYKCPIDINLQMKIMLNSNHEDDAIKLFLSNFNNNTIKFKEDVIRRLLTKILNNIFSHNNHNHNKKNQWTKGIETIKYFEKIKNTYYDRDVFLKLFCTLEKGNETNNDRKEGYILSLFLFYCKKNIVSFSKENIKKGLLIIENGISFSLIRLLFVQAMEYIFKNHPLFNNEVLPNSWWDSEFKIILPNHIKYKGHTIENEKILPIFNEEFKKLNPSFNILEKPNNSVNAKEISLDKSYIYNWIKNINNNSYTIFDILRISPFINSYLGLNSLLVE
ncbi:hypothetical protein BCR32DRAFT_263753 [Anaeromyces robustus]|uniref:Uncharacterized protein n=1 Tax=Anaeromyces robustus TaxID=1754192 RepID=A0A1Y1XQR3_9FUNG|nr:hypothetical protein BCR32DRAFT_263753 [Anaeromyces robustus]|eukprot:ORX88077.1 hypothetical protein BCR32DRAFT_263753 [Anaeromyces robustus]